MPSGLSARIKAKLSLHRRSSTSGVSVSSSTSGGLLEENADAASTRSSSPRRRFLQPSQSQARRPRPVSHIEVSSSTSSSRATGAIPRPSSPECNTTTATTTSTPAPANSMSRPRPKSTLGLMSAGQGAEAGASGAQASSGISAPAISSGSAGSAPLGAPVLAALASSSAHSPAVSPHPGFPSAASPPVSPPSGSRSAPPAPAAACSPSGDSDILHHQRLELQHRLKLLAQDPLVHDPALLPSPSARDNSSSNNSDSNLGACAVSPTLERISENSSTEPARKLRPPEHRPGDHGSDPRVHSLQGPLHASSSAPANAASSPPTPPTPAPSTSTRYRTEASSSTTTKPSSRSSPGPSAAPRRSSGPGPAIRQVKTARFAPDPAPESSVPSPAAMTNARKIWVRRPGASPTLITIGEDDLVDDVREIILRKYANSLGKTFDAPDLHLRLYPRDQKDRLLQPDEHMGRTLESYFPGGQKVEDAVIIDIPRRTPKASPHPSQHGHHGQQQQHYYTQQQNPHTAAAIYYTEDGRPLESGEGYFPPVGALPSPHMQIAMPPSDRYGGQGHSIAVLGTGHLPTIPSPGGLRSRGHREQSGRPRINRTHTSSSGMNGNHDPAGMPPGTMSHASMPKSPGLDPRHARIGTPPARLVEARSSSARPKRRQKNGEYSSGMMATVPPISVLIVEDNPINLKLLEAFVKRLKVRWQTATNGRDAVKKWRTGGFHLVLMDIQLPVMNGLEATREIRRLEQVNSIGVFSSVPTTPQEELALELEDKDRLNDLHLFKGPVIIVALTASSLQSDRHEALAAGCNDFLTKPVNFVWLERKVLEWGCMQALIDFDGWRTWKDFALAEEEANKKTAAAKNKAKKSRSSLLADV